MLILVIIALICLIVGVLFITNEDVLKKIEAGLNKTIVKGRDVGEQSGKLFGIFLVIFSIILFIIYLLLIR